MNMAAWHGPGSLVPLGVVLAGLGAYLVLEANAAPGLRMIVGGGAIVAFAWWLMR